MVFDGMMELRVGLLLELRKNIQFLDKKETLSIIDQSIILDRRP